MVVRARLVVVLVIDTVVNNVTSVLVEVMVLLLLLMMVLLVIPANNARSGSNLSEQGLVLALDGLFLFVQIALAVALAVVFLVVNVDLVFVAGPEVFLELVTQSLARSGMGKGTTRCSERLLDTGLTTAG